MRLKMKLSARVAALTVLALAGASTAAPAGEPSAFIAGKLKAAAPNTPVIIGDAKTGGRISPACVWSAKLQRVVLLGGDLGRKKRHYEIEHFDPVTGKWSNAYPKGAPFKTVSGPTDARPLGIPRRKRMVVVDAAGVSRYPGIGGFRGMLHHQYALDAESGKLFVQVQNETLIVDTGSSTAELTEAGRFNQGRAMVWGSFCFDPVNKEVVSVGGTSFEKGGTPGTWVFKTATKKWQKLKLGTPELAGLQKEIEKLKADAWTLLSYCRSRFFTTESPAEAKTKFAPLGGTLKAAISALAGKIKAAKLGANMKAGGAHALERLGQSAAILGTLGTKLNGAMSAELLAGLQNAYRLVEAAERDLASEPCGRAHSQMVWDPVNSKIVLFGGDGQDRVYSDTWIYHPKTRSWEQRYPKRAPAPRSCHLLGWLPGAGKVLLVGGYDENNRKLPFGVWTYDVKSDRWQNLHSGAPVWRTKKVPTHFKDLRVVGAVLPGDYVLLFEKYANYSGNLRTWAIKVDAAKPASGSAAAGGKPGAVSYSYGPDGFERAAKIDPGRMKAFFKNMPANTWVKMPKPPKLAPKRDYGTTRYDPLRKQFLWWGGGHVNYFGCEVSHYSVRSGCWTASDTAERYMEPGGRFSIHVDISFQGRPQIPVHAYQCYGFDQPSGLLLINTRGRTFVYHPAKRSWSSLAKKFATCAIRGTPQGAITCWSKSRNDPAEFMRFDAKKMAWVPLPKSTGDRPPAVGRILGDYNGFCPDSKRGCIWVFHRSGVWRYDIKTGASKKVRARLDKHEVAGYLRDMLYIPEIDKVVFENREGSDRMQHPVWDPEKLQWQKLFLEIRDEKGGRPKRLPKFSTGHGFVRDPDTGLWFVNGMRWDTYALRLDPKGLKFLPVGNAPPSTRKSKKR
jgi:Kelch motif